MVDWAAETADALRAERLGVVDLSAGGPFALGWGAVLPLAARVPAVGR